MLSGTCMGSTASGGRTRISLHTACSVMGAAEHREACESRGSLGETGIACTDEARDRVNVSMIALTTSISRLLMALVFFGLLEKLWLPAVTPETDRVQC